MACVQRMIQSVYKARVIPINRLGGSPISYRSLCSSSSGDGRSILSNGKRFYFIDTLAMVKGLEARGIPPKHAEAITSSMIQLLDELDKDPTQPFDLLQSNADSLRKSIKKMRRDKSEEPAIVQYSNSNLTRRALEKRANRSAKTAVIDAKQQLDEERMRLEAKESQGTFHVFLSLCVATVGASIIAMSAAMMTLYDQLYKS